MNSHTPGPWRVRQNPNDENDFHVSAPTPEGHPYFGRIRKTEIMSDENYPTKRADAQLIAAAPALLAACKMAIAEDFDGVRPADSAPFSQRLYDTLSEAILSAEERQ